MDRQEGSGNQCCYEQDGNLRYAADTYQGSTPDRSHDWGSVPYGTPGHVPSLSHWTHDVITFYYCCLWVEYRQCNYYMDRRATRDCKAYTPPHSGKHDYKAYAPRHSGKNYDCNAHMPPRSGKNDCKRTYASTFR